MRPCSASLCLLFWFALTSPALRFLICMARVDRSLTYSADLGYNVIRHRDAIFAPLKLLGRQNSDFLVLGSQNQLVTSSLSPLPAVTEDQPAGDEQLLKQGCCI
jgi:hypothetical protein